MKRVYLLLLVPLFLFTINLSAQNIAINNDGTPPNASAMLDVKSGTKGFLLPRMDSNSRKSLLSPANGLLVFDTSNINLWQYGEGRWSPFIKLPGAYRFNENVTHVLSIINDGAFSPIYVSANTAGGTGIESHGGRYGVFGKSENGIGAVNTAGVFGTYYPGCCGGYSTGGIGVSGIGAGGSVLPFTLNAFHFGLYGSAKDYGIYATAPVTGIAAQFKGQTWLQGAQHYSHFNYGSNEDTYIRGGKDNAAVVIADGFLQKATVGTGVPNSDAKLTVDDPNSTLYSGINATSNGIFKDTFSISGFQYEINDHRPAVKAIGAFGGNALEIDGQVAVSGNNRFIFDVDPQNTNPDAPGYYQQEGSYWTISLNHTPVHDPYYNNAAIFIEPYIAFTNVLNNYNLPSRTILFQDHSNGGFWKYVIDVPPIQVGKPIIRLKVMVIRTNPGSRAIN